MQRPNFARNICVACAACLIPLFARSVHAADAKKESAGTKNEKDGAEMIRIPGGQFLMGSTKSEVDAQFRDTGLPEDWKKHAQDEEPRHLRSVEPFYIYKFEVTNAQYKTFCDATGHEPPPYWKGTDYPADKGDHPVVEVSWDDAQAYCRWAGTRLPTEAEWEYAARGAEPAEGQPSRVFPWGDHWDRTLSNNASLHASGEIQSAADWKEWYDGDQKANFPLTSRGGSFPKSVSPFGVQDMAGNAWEWCAEVQAPYPDQNPEDAPDKKLRARRGGSWANVALHIRSADRQPAAHDDRNIYTGFRCAVSVPGPIKVEQAGDRFVNFVLDEIEATRKKLPAMSRAAEAAADRIVRHNGELLSAGDHSFSLEPVWRAGGIAFSRQYLPDKTAAAAAVKSASNEIPYYRTKEFIEHFTVQAAKSQDVVLLGYENEKEERQHLAALVKQLLADGALVIFFGSQESADRLEQEFGRKDNLVFITHDVPDGGILEVAGWPDKICSGRSIANRLYLWTFEAELIGAFLRRGKIPGILLSVTYESPQVWNLPLLHSYKFIPAFDATPVEKGILGDTYLNHLERIVSSIVPGQRAQFRKAAQWLAEAARTKHKSFALLIHGLDPQGLPGDPGLFKVYSEGNAYYPQIDKELGKDDVAFFVGYNWYPPQLANAVDKAGGKQILCFTLVQELPPEPAVYGEVGELPHYTSFDPLPQTENRIYIDLKFAQYNAVLKIPGYPILALETSAFAEDVVYWHLVADTIELLGQKAK
jgi:formylglycine-generating enzyme required for sulfatase activity/uncharacterized phosphosugar-binding protein